jgi:LacI family transcriptional regulator
MKALTSPAGAATIYDVARSAGVSTATVSRALNGKPLVAENTRARIAQAVEELGYEPNSVARSLVTRSTKTIGLLLPDITNPFFPELVKGVQLRAAERSYTLLLSHTGNDPKTEQRYLSLFRGKGIDGLLVVGLALGRAQLTKFAASGIPLVSLDRDVDLAGIPMVHLDNRAGARQATEHLLGLGHRSIAHIGGPGSLKVSQERLRGYFDALEFADVDPCPDLIVASDFTEAGGRAGCLALLESGAQFTSIFATNDLMAIGAMAALKEAGLTVPSDISVVGFDGIPLANYTTPPLTTLRQPACEMGRRAAQILIDAIGGKQLAEGERQVVFQGELVCRGSTAPALTVRA